MSREVLNAVDEAAITAVLRHINNYPELQAASHQLDLKSSIGSKVLLLDGDKLCAAKIYPDDNSEFNDVVREIFYLALLNEASGPPPMAIPEPIELLANRRQPQCVIMSRVPGVVLDYPEVRAMSSLEMQHLGSSIGAFAGWMTNAIRPQDYREILYETSANTFDRARVFDRFAQRMHDARSIGTLVLVDALEHTIQDFKECYGDLTRPDYVGHDDLRPTNISFEHTTDGWKPQGVIDFAEMKPMPAAREFRHLRLLGKEAASAAIDTYTAATGLPVSMEEVDIWAKYQITSGLVFGVAGFWSDDAASFNAHLKLVHELRPSLDVMYPVTDWSELDTITDAYQEIR
jgi:hypothetical protein